MYHIHKYTYIYICHIYVADAHIQKMDINLHIHATAGALCLVRSKDFLCSRGIRMPGRIVFGNKVLCLVRMPHTYASTAKEILITFVVEAYV